MRARHVRVQIATRPGSAEQPNEDAACADRHIAVVVDGVTARTPTGCVHGTAWFADQLARNVLRCGGASPAAVLRSAIAQTASLHSGTCDLSDPATPCAAVGIVQIGDDGILRHLVLSDVSIALTDDGDTRVVSDGRVEETARALRAKAGGLPHGSEAKSAALIRMKQAEIEARNRPGGYWVAGADPTVVDHALTGEVPVTESTRVALLSDGAARAVDLFRLMDWAGAMDLLAEGGPSALIARVRAAEQADGSATRWPRNKLSDDATVVYCDNLHERVCVSH
jgi:hypothetical protein